jgi:hypothetical protein
MTQKEQKYYLFENMFTENDFIELRAIDPTRQEPPITASYKLNQMGKINAFVHVFDGRWNIYFGVGGRKYSHGGSKHHIKGVKAVWVDIDVKAKHQNDYKKVIDCIKAFDYEPSVIIHSGNGLHLYWFLREPLLLADDSMVWYTESILRGLAEELKGDITVAEIARIMRMPGTMNVKDINHPIPCQILKITDKKYVIEDFEKYKVNVEYTKANLDYDFVPSPSIETINDVVCRLEGVKVRGDEVEALCPFHDDSHASFYINVNTGLWNCRACGAAGNIGQFCSMEFDKQLEELEVIMRK